MEVFRESFLVVYTWGMLPVLLTFMLLLAIVLIKCMKKDVVSPIEEFRDRKKYHKAEKIYSKVNGLSELYIFVCITLVILTVLVFFNVKYQSYVYQMIDKIEVISSIVIGLTTIAITMSVVIILFDKRYYIVFSIREVLQKYKFSEWLMIILFSCILVCVMTITLLGGEIDSYFDVVRFMTLEIGVIYNVVGITYILGVIINIMFLEKKNELSLLGQLYRRFGMYRIDTLHFKDKKNWSKEAVEINIEYLTERYVNICKCKRIMQIDEIEFVTTMDCYKKKWYGKARDKFIRMMLWLLVWSTFVDIMIVAEKYYSFVIFNSIITIIAIAMTYFKIGSVQLVIMRLYSDTWGYYIYKKSKGERLVPRVAARIGNVYDEYIMRMNSLNAFFYIWINFVENEQEHMQDMYMEVIKWLEEIKIKNMAIYFPVFTIGYFLFDNDIKIDDIRSLYKEIIEPEDKQFAFKKMLFSQIFYLTKNFNKEIFDYREKLNAYLKWIES